MVSVPSVPQPAPPPSLRVARRRLDLSAARLPAPSTPIVGREGEIAAVRALLNDTGGRLLTLTGPGGVGKTRLAIAVADAVAATDDPVAFIPLAAVENPALVVEVIARALGGREAAAAAAEQLPRLVGDHPLLLVLDTLEHLLPAAGAVGDLLGACSRLRILATSRAPLRSSGEQEFPVPPLSLPAPSPMGKGALGEVEAAGAVRLFVGRARAARPNFVLTEENAPAVADLCRRLDGLPLAIELAAARTGYLSPSAMVARLERPGARLPLLTGGARDQPARLRTMRAAIAWSYDLLDDAERALFRRLAVFVGGFSLDAATAVVGADEWATLDGVGSLVAKGLVRAEEVPNGEARFAMLDTIREFALEHLIEAGEEEESRRRHADWCVAYAERPDVQASGSAAPDRLDALERDHANLRAALGWLEERGEGPRLVRLAGALWSFWREHIHYGEGRRWLEAALAHEGAAADRLRVLIGAGTIAWYQTDIAQATRWHEEALALAREIGDRQSEAFALGNLGAHAEETGDLERAAAYHEEALAVGRAADEPEPTAMALVNLGYVVWRQGAAAAAAELMEEALVLARSIAMSWIEPIILNGLGFARSDLGEHERAAAAFQEGLGLAQVRGNLVEVIDAIEGLARLATAGGRPLQATRLFGAAAAFREELRSPQTPAEQISYAPVLAALHDALGTSAYSAAWAAGWSLSRQEATAEALAVRGTMGQPPQESTAGAQAIAAHGLTLRETEILRLLAEGLSNREIGDRLFISPATAARHVANIFAKLGVDSRARAAAYAHRSGLAH